MTEQEWPTSTDPQRMLEVLPAEGYTPTAEGPHVRGCWVLDLLLGLE
jgi:hypothetical protein